MSRIQCLVAAIGLALSAVVAQADEYHYNNILIGDRASGMGGAYTAISDDPSGLFYNPAGTVFAGDRNLSASVTAFNSTKTRYLDVLGGSRDYVRESSVLIPTFFGIVQPFGNGVAGFSYAVTDSVQEDQNQVFSGFEAPSKNDLITVNSYNTDATYKLGPSYAFEFTDNISLGRHPVPPLP